MFTGYKSWTIQTLKYRLITMGNTHSSQLAAEDEIRIILIGKSGCGKSATGNSILQKDCFKSETSTSRVTEKCRYGDSVIQNGTKMYNLVVVDTPGLYDPEISNEETSKEIVKCIGLTSPGPHVILFVVSLAVRFTQEEASTAEHFIKLFGEDLKKFMVIIFTHGDVLKKNEDIEERLKNGPKPLQDLIESCKNRYIVLNNTVTSKDKMKNQRSKLFSVITIMIEGNAGNCYTDEMYKKAEKIVQMRIEELKLEQELKEKARVTREVEKQMEERKREEKKAGEIDLRKTVRIEVEEESGVLEKIGNGIYEGSKALIGHAVESTGLPGLVRGIGGFFGYK